MRLSFLVAVALMVVASSTELAVAANEPSVLIVGKWKDRHEPDDAVIELLKEGKGQIVETTKEKTTRVNISWKVTATFGNACIVVVKYEVPKANHIEPLTWLIAFDGENTFILQPTENKIVYMDRQKN
jgi:hypothetical protein